jgi:hypothetical protein
MSSPRFVQQAPQTLLWVWVIYGILEMIALWFP